MKKEADSNRIENILAILLINSMKGFSLLDKAKQLSLAGFTTLEIANLLDANQSSIATLLSRSKKKRK